MLTIVCWSNVYSCNKQNHDDDNDDYDDDENRQIIFREHMLVNTPISIYSVGSTVSRRSSGIDSQYDSRQPQGTPPNWPNHYNKVNIT